MMPLWLGVTIAIFAVAGMAAAVAIYRRSSYAVPWFILLGPGDSGRTALADLLDAALVTNRGFGIGWRHIARQLGLRVWRGGDGVVVDVAAFVPFPTGQPDLAGWRRVLRLIKRYRPRRPVDGLILAIPAPLLLDGQSSARDLGAALRDRLAQIQSHFGFILPLYVIVTECDALRGFTGFTQALPEPLRRTMVGWSNDRTSAAVRDAVAGDLTALGRLAFRREWIAEGMASLERSLAASQVALLASCGSPNDAAGLLLFSGEVQRLADPLTQVLEEALRPNLYQGSSCLRGFYLCGRTAFADDLFHRKIFLESGLAVPRPEVAVERLRGRLAAQVVCGVLAVVLAVGTAWSYVRLRGVQPSYSRLLAAGPELSRNQPGTTLQERLVRRRAFLEQAMAIKRGRLSEIATRVFMPASLRTERELSSVVRDVFGATLGDFRAGLEEKWEDWHRNAAFGPGDRLGPLGPDLNATAPYKALDRFADGYQRFIDNYERHGRLGRAEGAGDLAAASGILEYLTGAGLTSTTLAPSLARAIRDVRSSPIDCQIVVDPQTRDSLVAMRASDLLTEFRTVSFDDLTDEDTGPWRNVVAGVARFQAGWASVEDSSADDRALAALMDDTTKLSDAVQAWAAFRGPSSAVAIPVFAKPPFKQHPPADGFCDALRPDLSSEIRAVEALRDRLTVRLLTEQVAPFGHIVEEGEGGLAFTSGMADLKAGFDDLGRQSFWQQLPANLAVALPANPTWRKEDVDAALQVANAFDAYRRGAFRTLDDFYRGSLLNVAEAGVAQVVSATLAASAAPGGRATRPEEIARLGVQLASMERLIPWLAGEPEFGTTILGSLDNQARQALETIDRDASAGYFFSRRSGSPLTSSAVFAAWRDIKGAVPAAEGPRRWSGIIDTQLAGVRQFAAQAGPIVEYLSGRAPSDRVRRWTAIVAAVADYDQKRPGNALSALEAVMREDMPSMVPDKNCGIAGNGTTPAGVAFFDTVLKDLVSEGLRQCLEVRYASIASEFARLLANKFPFSQRLDGAPEATRDQVAQFLRVYEEQGGPYLGTLLDSRSCGADASGFVRQMEKAYPLLTSVVPVPPGSRAPTAPAIALDVAPEFRVARELDRGGSQLGDWQLEIGRQTLRERAPSTPGTWTSGDPVSVTVRFARDSPSRPVPRAPTAAGMGAPVTIGDRTVRWEFGGGWALFRLLRAGRTVASSQTTLQDVRPVVLGFDIPVEPDRTRPPLVGGAEPSLFQVFMRVSVSQKDKTIPLDVDEFPFQAPISASCSGL